MSDIQQPRNVTLWIERFVEHNNYLPTRTQIANSAGCSRVIAGRHRTRFCNRPENSKWLQVLSVQSTITECWDGKAFCEACKHYSTDVGGLHDDNWIGGQS